MKFLMIVGAICAVIGALVAATGIIPIDASSGHWAVTRWVLQFSKERSVATHSRGVEVPALDGAGQVAKGATYYEVGCRGCHGSPALHTPRIVRRMTPTPPYLPGTVGQWKPRELFHIVKHGIKLTGMPAWPSLQRDDEVWAMVAFLRRFPELDDSGYQKITRVASGTAGAAVPGVVSGNCARCHGVDGLGGGTGGIPVIAGQRVAYMSAALEAYARGTRHSGIMEPVAAELSAPAIREAAEYYGALRAPARAAGDVSRGEAIAQKGVPAQEVPACVACHGPGAARRNPMYPRLAGQYAEYLALQLTLFKQDHRGGGAYAHLMRPVAGLTAAQIEDVARYYASLAED